MYLKYQNSCFSYLIIFLLPIFVPFYLGQTCIFGRNQELEHVELTAKNIICIFTN